LIKQDKTTDFFIKLELFYMNLLNRNVCFFCYSCWSLFIKYLYF